MTAADAIATTSYLEFGGRLDASTYEAMYRRSADDPEGFWREHGRCLDWYTSYTEVRDVSYGPDDVGIRWFHDGTLNASYNCLDRHLPDKGEQVALIWEGDSPNESRRVTYRELHHAVCKFASGLQMLGIRRGDRVTIYLPMIPEAVVAMLACARVGAIHSVVFAGFSPEALAGRINDCHSRLLITADVGLRGGKRIPLKRNADQAIENCPSIEACVVVKRTGGDVPWRDDRDVWYHDVQDSMSAQCAPAVMSAEDPLFILYTSGSTGKPKGVLHTTGGYLVACAMTHRYVLDYHEGDVYWCTADVGWVTGHSYIVYGPLANGATTLLFEGVPNHPTPSRFWEICDKHGVNIFYTAPTAIRALMREGDGPVERTSRRSIRLLGTVGEPINPEVWRWYHKVVGNGLCPVVDTWWQTETGAIAIAPVPGAIDLKPGSATRPFFGVKPVILDDDGNEIVGAGSGNLCLADGGPGMMRTVYGNHQRFVETYFKTFPGYFSTGDGCRRDEDGYYWITGRVDDVINVSGHRLGTAEIESAIVAHPKVAEAAVVGYPHQLKGQGVYAYVTLVADEEPSERLQREVIELVRQSIGAIAKPDIIQWSPNLPKTRSGKIMRRILRKIAENDLSDFGDTSTLAEPSIVGQLVEERKKGEAVSTS